MKRSASLRWTSTRSVPVQRWPALRVAADRDLVDRLAQRAVVEHDARVLAAHLERDQQLGAIERGLEDPAADRPAPGEAQARAARSRSTIAAPTSPVPTTTLSTPGGKLGGERRLGVALAAQRRDVARLDHHRVAREQRGDHVGVAQVERKVERADHADHAERLVAQRARRARPARA